MTVATRPRARTDLTVVEIDGEALILDARVSQLHRLNSTGRVIFSLCDGSATVAELAADIAELYDLPSEDVHTHVGTLLSGLQAAGLLEDAAQVEAGSPVEPPPPPLAEPPAQHLHTKRRGNP
ncbi:MAG: PqqD family protein [Actinomycetota bacterium]|nr:PqqD family protein [Actinomycetota bacterium]